MYQRLEEVIAETATELDRVRRSATAGTPGARSERDALASVHSDHLIQLNAVGDRLCFGRLDLRDNQRRYVGRVGLSDDEGVRLLIDWRAPAAEAFYRATAADPLGVISRRHLTTAGRTVTAISDEVLDLDAFAAAGRDSATVSEDGALMLSLNAHRSGQMHDIVATIQAEQDRIIREALGGVLVVQGGPGTGKTAVALHRAAYLLYAHRDRLARTGVLLVGPNPRFLRYIDQVLPSLGETGVVMSTPGQLYPGVDASGQEDAPEVAVVKGRPRMATVLAAAVRARQRVPERPIDLDVDGVHIRLMPEDVRRARSRAQASHKPHNEARTTFVIDLLNQLVRQYAEAIGTALDDPGAPDARTELLATLRDSRDVRREVNLCWLPLTPEQLLRDLYAEPERLVAAAPRMNSNERKLLFRERTAPWTVSDVALLDEAAELLGADDAARRRNEVQSRAERIRAVEYAQAVLQQSQGAIGDDEAVTAGEIMTAEQLADRQEQPRVLRSAVEQAEGDRTWAFGHIIVDEAQELSAMQWRLLMRRCPSRSMTLVGDTAQTGSPAGARSWGYALDRYVKDRWRLQELTVNYRTPGQIMDVATDLLSRAGIRTTPLTSARTGDWPPTARRIESGSSEPIVQAALAELDAAAGGTVVVIAPRAQLPALATAIAASAPDAVASERLSVLSAGQVKGLEFDAVVLVEPAEILDESPRGVNDLYVALTRPTQRLHVVHALELPVGL